MIGVHSFTPVLGAVRRPMHAGVLFGASAAFGRAVLSDLREETHLTLAENAPYKIDNDHWTIPHHADSRYLPGLLLEIRHDGLESTGTWGGGRIVSVELCLQGGAQLRQDSLRFGRPVWSSFNAATRKKR